jgi:hypothetical protein
LGLSNASNQRASAQSKKGETTDRFAASCGFTKADAHRVSVFSRFEDKARCQIAVSRRLIEWFLGDA